ncbi:CPBP family intramembrane glutamic endopeptidase [Salinactinospora qingdaonensis]|uniref:CAAX prenyl protease 2/Lysostaphin resistance protein A-like domain-containing protein n=1 Tax=Salinactinospora qingdaonensis TaxID=702744 RepID=A0ABP7FJB1_9ACTN
MPLLGVVVAFILYVLVQFFLGITAGLIALFNGIRIEGGSFFGAPAPDLAVQLIIIAMMIPVVLFTVRFVHRRRAGTLLSVEGRLRWPWLFVCAGVAVVSVALSITSVALLFGISRPDAAFVGEWVGAREFAVGMLVVVLLVPFQASAEEIALRGFLMQSVGSYGAPRGELLAAPKRLEWRGPARMPVVAAIVTAVVRASRWPPLHQFLRTPILAIVVSGSVFALLHPYSAWAMADVALFGVTVAWLAWYTGGLEAPIALHVVHNLAAFGLSAYEGTLEQRASSGSWQGLAGTAIEMALFCAVVVILARRMRLRRTVADKEHDDSPPPALPPTPAGPPQQGQPRFRPDQEPHHPPPR